MNWATAGKACEQRVLQGKEVQEMGIRVTLWLLIGCMSMRIASQILAAKQSSRCPAHVLLMLCLRHKQNICCSDGIKNEQICHVSKVC